MYLIFFWNTDSQKSGCDTFKGSKSESKCESFVIDTCLQSRNGDTPVLIARQVGRENQTKKFFTLKTFPFKEIDMLSIIIIGNSQTTLIDEIFVTPRGYLQN